MKKTLNILILLLLFCGTAYARDGFETVRCGSDIPQALIGKHTSNEPVVATEGRHKDLGLKDLGADEISDHLSTIFWLICGNEFLVIEDDHSVVRDALAFPSHSKSSPGFTGYCQVKDQKVPGVIVAVLEDKSGTEALLPAKTAWKIDEKSAKFIKMSTQDLRCPRNGIFTQDGGL